MSESVDIKKTLDDQAKLITELKIVIDTAQAALRRASSTLEGDDLKHVINKSAKWVMEYET